MVQWLRICLAVQGTKVQSLVWEDPTCHRATKPMHLKLEHLEPVLHSRRSQQNKKP